MKHDIHFTSKKSIKNYVSGSNVDTVQNFV